MLIDSIKEVVSTRYLALQPESSTEFALRTGFYFIEEVYYKSTGKVTQLPFAKAKWSRTPKAFIEGLSFDIELLTLYYPLSCGSKDITPEELIGKVIQITESATTPTGSEGNQGHHAVHWNIFSDKGTILPVQQLFFKLFFYGNKSLADALQINYKDTLPLKVIEEIEDWESNRHMEGPEDGNDSDPYDAPDAPIEV